MTRLYSKRVLLPFVGVLQIADLGWARALSLNGINWIVRYHDLENEHTRKGRFNYDPRVNIAMTLTLEHGQMHYRQVRADMNSKQAETDAQRIFEVLNNSSLPFAANDHYEYWLLDATDNSPLALLHTCIDSADMAEFIPEPVWHAIPAAELDVPDPLTQPDGFYHPPVNYRIQEVIERRAGRHPRGAWFHRTRMKEHDYPPCLIKDTWEDDESQHLCNLYINRLAPRLLMLDGLSSNVRERLEISASQHAQDVENFYHLYPEIVDADLLTRSRVEARLRSTN